MGQQTPALDSKPDIPWYYEVIIDHFSCLSSSRSYHMSGPNPIDIPSILSYNKDVAKMRPTDFIYLMQSIDRMYLKKVSEKQNSKTKGK